MALDNEMSKRDEERLMIKNGCVLRRGVADGKPLEYWDIARGAKEIRAADLRRQVLEHRENNK